MLPHPSSSVFGLLPAVLIPLLLFFVPKAIERFSKRAVYNREEDTRSLLFSSYYWDNDEVRVWLAAIALSALAIPHFPDIMQSWMESFDGTPHARTADLLAATSLVVFGEALAFGLLFARFTSGFGRKVQELSTELLPKNLQPIEEPVSGFHSSYDPSTNVCSISGAGI